MRFEGLRDYLAYLEEKGCLDRVTDPVSLEDIPMRMKRQETTGKAILFDRIEGYSHPLVNNLFASREFLAGLMDCTVSDVPRVFGEKMEGRIPPVMVDRGPCQELVFEGEQIDIRTLPFLQHAEKDAGRFITAGMVIAKDPETGVRNCSFNRMQLKGTDKTGFRMSPGQDLEAYYKKAMACGKRLELAVAIGNHPLDLLAAACGPARDVDELDIAGSLRGEPVPLVKCRTVDLEVPANAEIILEGYLGPGELEEEGPFGDFMGFYIERSLNHVFHVTCVTMRGNAIAQAITAGSRDDVTLLATPREAQLYDVFHRANADVRGINLMLTGNYLMGVVSIKKQHENEPTNLILAAFGSFKFLKVFMVVDEDVNIYDPSELFWAMGSRMRADRGIITIPNAMGFGRDKYGIHTTKLGMDLTAPMDSGTEFERVHPLGWK